VRTKLTHVARQLVDKTNGKTMPSNTQTLIEGLPRHGDGHGLLPWSDHELNELIKILGSISHPINMSMDESALGARALAGIVMAHLWMESIPQPIEGPTDKPGDAVPAPATPGTLKTSSTATALQICIEKLAACDSVVRIKACLDSALEPFEKPQRLPDGKIAYVDRLRSALAIVEVEKDHVSVVGSELMHPPIRKPCNDVHQLNMFPSLAA
jgi:hypothetical protein